MGKGIQRLEAGLIGIGKILNHIQKIFITIFFWLFIIALILVFFANRPPGVPDKAALVLNPAGKVVEQLSGNQLSRAMNIGSKEVLLKDLLDAVNMAKDDKRIQALILKTDKMRPGTFGISKLLELKTALDEFKKTGKKIIALGDDYYQDSYFLAAQADEVYIDPLGMVFLKGLGTFGRYYKDGLEKFNVDVHVFRVGKYKTAVEPFFRNTMSDEAKEAYLALLNDLWSVWLKECAAGRGIETESIQAYINNFKDSIIGSQGDTAKIALDAGLVDKIAEKDEIRKRLIQLVGEDEKNHNYKQIGYRQYLAASEKKRSVSKSGKNIIGIVVAKGEIFNGTRPPGEIGGDSTAELVRKARLDKDIKAIVLRVDSPGGSAFASELIRRECELARNDGKPVIISMGSFAASGGYMISLASDEIWASPATITGSIGIFGLFPTIDKALSGFLGIHVDGVGTTPLAGIDRIDMPINPELEEIFQGVIDQGYDNFITRVAKARNMEKDAVDAIAQGRVWSGEQALKIGLVDKLGGLKNALDSAASHAGLGKDYQVQYIKQDMTQREKIIAAISGKIQTILPIEDIFQGHKGILMKSAGGVAKEIDLITRFNDPKGTYAYLPFMIDQ